MATSFRLYPGYAYSHTTTIDEILEIARSIPAKNITDKSIDFGCPPIDDEGVPLSEYVARYQHIPSEDLTCLVAEGSLFAIASGGGKSRAMKEAIRRAFFILVMNECFKRGLSVSLEIG